jgi:hypothetical protein
MSKFRIIEVTLPNGTISYRPQYSYRNMIFLKTWDDIYNHPEYKNNCLGRFNSATYNSENEAKDAISYLKRFLPEYNQAFYKITYYE